MTKGLASIVWVLTMSGLASHAHADEAGDIAKANSRLTEPTRELLATHRNLIQMRRSLTKSDKEGVDTILWAEDIFDGIRSELKAVGVIFENMDARSDKVFAGAMYEEDAKSFVIRANNAIEEINYNLPSITNAAALAEATKLRDLILKMRDIIVPVAQKEKS
jgi:hypothetical protein